MLSEGWKYGAGEENREPRPLPTLEPKVSREQREMVNQRVSCGPGPAPKGHLWLLLSVF